MGEQATTNEEGKEVCPVCGSSLNYRGGCMTCANPDCGWAACG